MLAGWDPAEGFQLPLGTWSFLALALTLRVAGLSGHMESRLPPSHLICWPRTGRGTSEKQRQVLQKGGAEGKVEFEALQPDLTSGRRAIKENEGGLSPSQTDRQSQLGRTETPRIFTLEQE